MRISEAGIAMLEAEEGVVLRAYRCPVGVWTIGAGLTAASGVVTPHAGMVITAHDASDLLKKALARNYEPAVDRAMAKGLPVQHEFDAGVMFHFNTGAIARASWVKAWIADNAAAARKGLAAWNKGGGKVLPGLVKRREREADLLLNGVYAPVKAAPATATAPRWSRIALPLSAEEFRAARAALASLGYAVGSDAIRIPAQAVEAFQRDHDLTVDGILGRATLSTLQRRIDARRKTAVAAPAVVMTGAGDSSGYTDALAGVPWAGAALLGLVLIWAAWLAFQYRDVIAAAVQRPLPRLARFLRSI
ncbi:MAG: glycoside hydrolase family protein [Rhodobacter sp.]|nr:glycoside hydrolase family protein [Rhodobacter sp.]